MSYIGTALRISPTRDIALGNGVLTANSGADNCAIGDGALEDNTSGISNCAFGTQSLASNLVGNGNTALGAFALRACLGDSSVAIGNGALYSSTVGGMTAIGDAALFENTIGTSNLAIGLGSLSLNVVGSNNLAVGEFALNANLADLNFAIGADCLKVNTTGTRNSGAGFAVLNANIVGNDNTGFGHEVLLLSIGSDNTAMGSNCARLLSSGYKNTIIGSDTASAAPTLNACTIIGKGAAGFILTSLTNGTLIGAGANAVDGLTNVIAIGVEAVVSASNCAVIGGTGVNAVNLGLGTSLPTARLSVYGGIVVKQDVTVNGPGAYNVLVTDYIVKFNTTVATAQAFLPDPTTPTNEGQVFIFKDISGTAGVNNITIFPGGAATIDGAASYVINVSYGSITVFSDGTNYYIT